MRKKITVLALSALLLDLSVSAEAQQPTKVPRIGLLLQAPPTEPQVEAFRQGLRDLGYIEGEKYSYRIPAYRRKA